MLIYQKNMSICLIKDPQTFGDSFKSSLFEFRTDSGKQETSQFWFSKKQGSLRKKRLKHGEYKIKTSEEIFH